MGAVVTPNWRAVSVIGDVGSLVSLFGTDFTVCCFVGVRIQAHVMSGIVKERIAIWRLTTGKAMCRLPYPANSHFFFLYEGIKFVMITRYKFNITHICFCNSDSVRQRYSICCL